jgi:hypothetical protein
MIHVAKNVWRDAKVAMIQFVKGACMNVKTAIITIVIAVVLIAGTAAIVFARVAMMKTNVVFSVQEMWCNDGN